jgi:hypothetical protein
VSIVSRCTGVRRAAPNKQFDQFRQFLRAAVEALQSRDVRIVLAGFVEQHFGNALHDGDRRAQRVARIGEEGELLRVGFDQARLVVVDGVCEMAEFVVGRTFAQVRRRRCDGQGIDGFRQRPDGRECLASEHPTEPGRDRHADHDHRGEQDAQVHFELFDVAQVDGEPHAAGGGVEHADVDALVGLVFVDTGTEARQFRRWLGEIAAEALGARKLDGQAVGDAQAVILGLATQDLGGDDVLVVLGDRDHRGGEQQGHHQPQRCAWRA